MVILDQLINDGDLSLLDQAIISYVYFVNHNNDAPKTAGDKVCHATNEWLAVKFSCSKRTIINAIKRLEEKKWINIFRQTETAGCMLIEKRYLWVNEEKLSALGEADIKARIQEVKMRNNTQEGGEEISLGGVKELQYTPVKNFQGVGCQNCNDIKKDPLEMYIERSKEDKGGTTFVKNNNSDANASVVASDNPHLDHQAIKDKWNAIAQRYRLQTINVVSPPRVSAYKARIKDIGGEDAFWSSIETAIKNSAFLRGQNNRKWKVTFDWITTQSRFIRVVEGNYSDGGSLLDEPAKPIEKASEDFVKDFFTFSEDFINELRGN